MSFWSKLKTLLTGGYISYNKTDGWQEHSKSDVTNYVRGGSGTILDNIVNKYTGSGLTDAETQANDFTASENDASRQHASKEAELAYERQLEYYDTRLSPSAQISSQMDGIVANGLNPALMYGGSMPSASPSSVPQSGSVGAGHSVSPSSMDVLGAVSQLLKLGSEISVNESIANKNNAEADESGARKLNYQELAGLTAQQRLTEIERTSEVAAQAANLTQKTKIDMERWNKESLKLGEEITEIQKRQGVLDAEKDKLIADKLAQEANASYRRWYADTAELRYWVDTGFKVLTTGIEIARVASVWKLVKSKLVRSLPNVTDGGNVDDQGYGGYHRSASDDFIDYMDEVITEIDKLPSPQQPLSLPAPK